MSAPIAVIIGASSKHDFDGSSDELPASTRFGLGGALAMKFAEEGFHVVLTARRAEVLEKVAAIVREKYCKKDTRVLCIPMDITKDEEVEAGFTRIAIEFETSHIECLAFNAGTPFPPGFSFGKDAPLPHELDVSWMNVAHDTQVGGLIRCTKHCLPGMLKRESGSILVAGATMQLRGGAKFGAIAPGKTALRSLTQSMWQAYEPLGVHVCNVNIDGVIDSPATRKWGLRVEEMMKPDDIAGQFLAIHRQPKSTWSYEIMCTPAHSAASVGMRM